MDTITNKLGLSYKYQIDPNGVEMDANIQSNTTSTNLIISKLEMIKTVDKKYATINDILTYTIVLNNSGNILLSDIIFKSILPQDLEFVEGSVKVDDISQPTYNITTGFDLGSMITSTTKTVIFQAKVISLPLSNTIINKSTTTFNYLAIDLTNGTAESNEVTTNINVSTVTAIKSASANDVESGNELIYTCVITNTGNVDATNITLLDTISDKLSFNTGSVTINGIEYAEYNPNTGFTITDMTPESITTVVFKVTVL